jgi:hypothetical protein
MPKCGKIGTASTAGWGAGAAIFSPVLSVPLHCLQIVQPKIIIFTICSRYTQNTPFYRVLNERLRGTDRSEVDPYKPCVSQ